MHTLFFILYYLYLILYPKPLWINLGLMTHDKLTTNDMDAYSLSLDYLSNEDLSYAYLINGSDFFIT